MSETDRLAQEIRRVDGAHTLGAGALAEALGPFIEAVRAKEREQTDREPSDAEVEAAAKTLAQWDGANWDAEEWDGEIPKESYRRGARAALIAAQGVRRVDAS